MAEERVAREAHPRPWELEEEQLKTLSLPLTIDGNEHHPHYPALQSYRKAAQVAADAQPCVLDSGGPRRLSAKWEVAVAEGDSAAQGLRQREREAGLMTVDDRIIESRFRVLEQNDTAHSGGSMTRPAAALPASGFAHF